MHPMLVPAVSGGGLALLIRVLIRVVLFHFLFRYLGYGGTIAVVIAIALGYYLYTRYRQR